MRMGNLHFVLSMSSCKVCHTRLTILCGLVELAHEIPTSFFTVASNSTPNTNIPFPSNADIVDEDSDHSDLFITPSNVDTHEEPRLISFQPTSLTGAPIPAPQTHDESAPRPPPPVQFSTATSSSVHLYDISTEASHDAVSQPKERYMSLSDSWIIRVLLLLVCFLNLHHHVGVRACNLLLWVFRKILIELRIIKCFDDFPVTLKTVLNRLHMSLPAKIFVLCEKCWQLFPHGENVRHCPHCEIPLYRGSFVDAFQGLIWGKGQKVAKPKVVMPVAPLSALLAGFLSRSDIEAEVEQWGSTHRNLGVYTSIMDGRVWKEMKDKDGKEFFRINRDTGELRLGMTLSLDWFVFHILVTVFFLIIFLKGFHAVVVYLHRLIQVVFYHFVVQISPRNFGVHASWINLFY